MSTALAIAGITQILRDLLNDGLVDHDVAAAVGNNVTVHARPPDRALTIANDSPALNVFLYYVTSSQAWSNQCLPTRDPPGQRLQNTPLALDLFYMISAYATEDLHADILLGHAMQILHEHPGVSRAEIQIALNPAPGVAGGLPPELEALADTGLADQAEAIRIVPHYLSPEEMSRIWTSLQSHYRPSMAYRVSTVLIEALEPGRQSLPVLTIGPDNTGVEMTPTLTPSRPTLARVIPPALQPSVRPGDTFDIQGVNLAGVNPVFYFENLRLAAPLSVVPHPGGTDAAQSVTVPDVPADWASGTYLLTLEVEPPGGGTARLSNALPLQIAPVMSLPPVSVVRDVSGAVTVTLAIRHHLQPGQGATLYVGATSSILAPVAAPTPTLVFEFPEMTAGSYPIWITVDGVDSWLIDRDRPPVAPDFTPRPPVFDTTQTVVVPA